MRRSDHALAALLMYLPVHLTSTPGPSDSVRPPASSKLCACRCCQSLISVNGNNRPCALKAAIVCAPHARVTSMTVALDVRRFRNSNVEHRIKFGPTV